MLTLRMEKISYAKPKKKLLRRKAKQISKAASRAGPSTSFKLDEPKNATATSGASRAQIMKDKEVKSSQAFEPIVLKGSFYNPALSCFQIGSYKLLEAIGKGGK